MTFYIWLLRGIFGEIKQTNTVTIEEVTQHNENHLCFTRIYTTITPEFVEKIMKEALQMLRIINISPTYIVINKPKPHARICEKWGQVCEVAHLCEYYEATLGDPRKRMYFC